MFLSVQLRDALPLKHNAEETETVSCKTICSTARLLPVTKRGVIFFFFFQTRNWEICSSPGLFCTGWVVLKSFLTYSASAQVSENCCVIGQKNGVGVVRAEKSQHLLRSSRMRWWGSKTVCTHHTRYIKMCNLVTLCAKRPKYCAQRRMCTKGVYRWGGHVPQLEFLTCKHEAWTNFWKMNKFQFWWCNTQTLNWLVLVFPSVWDLSLIFVDHQLDEDLWKDPAVHVSPGKVEKF